VDYETYLSESLTFNTHFELITSRPVLEQVIRDLKLDQVDKKQDEFIEINPERTPLSEKTSDYIIMGKAGEVVKRLTAEIEHLKNLNPT